MTRVTARRTINAPAHTVFRAVTDIPNLPATHPDIVSVEFLSASQSGLGTRFRETRAMGNTKHVTDLEITEFVENEHVRMVADSHGTIWDTVFMVTGDDTQAELTLIMDARAQKLMPKLLNPVMKGLFRKGLEKHVDAVKAYCEQG